MLPVHFTRSILFGLISFFCIEVSAQSSCSYSYRKRITFNPAYVSGGADLTNFPVVIKITNDNDIRVSTSSGHVQNSSGFDIIFTAADGVTQLNHQLISYTGSSGSLECWVKIPLLSASVNSFIYMYYGNSTINTDQSSTSTWSNGYAGVWHFDNNLNNATSTSGLNGTNNSSSNSTTAMLGGNARAFNGSSQYIDVTPYTSAYDLYSTITVSGWIRLSSNGADQKIAGNQDNTNGGWKLGIFSDNKVEFEIRTSGNSPYLSRSASGGSTLSTSTWYYVVGQYSNPGGFINTYVNGALDRNYLTSAVAGTSTGTMKIGREPFSSGAFFSGNIDELRVSNVIRTAGWIATEYANQNSPGPGTLYTISSEPKVWTGGTNTNFNTTSNWSNNSAANSGDDVIITSGSNQPTLQNSLQINSLFLKTGATLSLATNTLSLRADITNCGTITGSTGQVNLNSVTVQTQYFSGGGNYNLTDLTINNTFSASPAVVLNTSVSVAGILTLTSGIVYTSTTNILSLGISATSSSGSASSFISGPISKTGTANFVFPVGKGNLWRRASVTNISASSTFRAEYFNTPYSSTTPVNSPLNHVSQLEYWQVDRVSGSGNANLSLYWESASLSGITTCSDLTIARYNGSSWDERAGTTSTSSSCSGSGTGIVTTNTALTAFSPFTFGAKSGTINPLPIELTSFEASCARDKVLLNWSTATESRNAYFLVERSLDGESWVEVGRVNGAGTSATPKYYSLEDAANTSQIVYYRLSQVDVDGGKKIYPVITSNCITSSEKMQVYPNPASHEVQLHFELSKDYGVATIRLMDKLGRMVQQQDLELAKGKSTYKLPLTLPPGAYSLLFFSNQLSFPATRLIIE